MSNTFPEGLTAAAWTGEGLKAVVSTPEGWMVGVKNYKPACDCQMMTVVERHLETEEVFMLAAGQCTLVLGGRDREPRRPLELVALQPGQTYCIARGTWHNTVLSRDAKLFVVENANTSGANSESTDLTPEDRALISTRARSCV